MPMSNTFEDILQCTTQRDTSPFSSGTLGSALDAMDAVFCGTVPSPQIRDTLRAASVPGPLSGIDRTEMADAALNLAGTLRIATALCTSSLSITAAATRAADWRACQLQAMPLHHWRAHLCSLTVPSIKTCVLPVINRAACILPA